MTPGARLQTTIELLDLVGAEPRPADATVSQFFRNRRFIGAKDRADIAQAVYRSLRRRARLGWWLNRYEHPATARALALADQIAGEGRDADAVAGLFNGGKFAPMPLDDGERRLVRQLAGHTLDHPDMPEAVRVEVPGLGGAKPASNTRRAFRNRSGGADPGRLDRSARQPAEDDARSSPRATHRRRNRRRADQVVAGRPACRRPSVDHGAPALSRRRDRNSG